MSKKLNMTLEELEQIAEVNITLEDLKRIADSMGYELHKKRERLPKIKPCICGHEMGWLAKVTLNNPYLAAIKCKNCGRMVRVTCRNKREIIKNWNQMIEAELDAEAKKNELLKQARYAAMDEYAKDNGIRTWEEED